ncbi:uncharacterized protein LOC134455306 [Engraulis encrasicolus]|uniref:uncharacterized protein LOC134455306 n=1 Tax=Engraulis encrasicolus TaxID=184585 RepID=UPI002FD763A2
MAPLWILCIFLALQTTLASDIVEPGPQSGIVLQDAPGLLLTNCRVHTQRVYARLDPWDVYRKHFRSPSQMNLETGPTSEIGSNIEHAKRTTSHMLEQLQKFIVTEEELSGKARPKRFLGGLLTAASAIGSLFSVGLSAVNTVSLTAVKREISTLKEEMPEIQNMCTSTKDIHWVCPSNPFIRDTTDRLCGLSKVPDQKCAAQLSTKDERALNPKRLFAMYY